MFLKEEWTRTRPDFVVYRPPDSSGADAYNDHFLVDVTPGGALLAVWTQGSREGADDLRVVSCRSLDGGATWSSPQPVPIDSDLKTTCFGFPLISRSGRIACFYNCPGAGGNGERYFSGPLGCSYSDDDGSTWRSTGVQIPYPRTRYDHPDPAVPCNCIVWQKPVRDSMDRWITGYTRWSSFEVFPRPKQGYHFDSSAGLIRFEENNAAGSAPTASFFPESGDPIRVPCPLEPEHARGYSLCEEPAVVLLPDGRLFMVVRTLTGAIWYSVSADDGSSWSEPEVLRFTDRGDAMLHPKAPCPVYAQGEGRFLLFFHNHDGRRYGAAGPGDMNARRPVFAAVGTFQPGGRQPVWFGSPRLLMDTEGVSAGSESRPWLSMYASLTEREGRRVFWYPDRKHFLLGRVISDEWLSGIE